MSLEDRERINLAAGVFVRPAVARYVRGGPRVYDRRQTLDTISRGDGVTQTMMFSENTAATRWSRTRLGDIGFAWAASDRRGFVRPAKKPGGFGNAAGPLAFEKLPDDAPWLPSSRPTSTEGTAPRPSAMHDGGILAVYCDGHAGRVSEDIDPSVYVRLLTPNGNACGQEPLPKNADF